MKQRERIFAILTILVCIASLFRMARAVQGYTIGAKLHDCTGDVKYYFVTDDNRTLWFTHEEDVGYLLPLIQEE